MLLKKFTFYLAVAGIVGTVFLITKLRKQPPPPPPLVQPARSPFPNSLAATGIIEAKRENVKIATSKAGLVQKVFVEVGSKVKAGEPLFQLDDRETRTTLASAKAQVEVLRASLLAEKAMAEDAEDQLTRVDKLRRDNVASEDEQKRKEFAVKNWRARVEKIEADLKAAQAQVDQVAMTLDVLTIRAPRDGSLLQVNVRAGEHAALSPTEPLMILGDTDTLQIRADVDEQNAPLVETKQPAVAFLKGETKNALPLRFVRVEPFVIPKKSLTGDSSERVDTRVLQLIFELDRPAVPLYVGQQVDVFIQRTPSEAAPAPAPIGAQTTSTP